LAANPKKGDVIPGLSGLRKVPLKGMGKGKSGGFRVDYLDVEKVQKIYFLILYPKNLKEDLTPEEKQMLRSKIEKLKVEATKNG
jgi:hypothetical protein